MARAGLEMETGKGSGRGGRGKVSCMARGCYILTSRSSIPEVRLTLSVTNPDLDVAPVFRGLTMCRTQ